MGKTEKTQMKDHDDMGFVSSEPAPGAPDHPLDSPAAAAEDEEMAKLAEPPHVEVSAHALAPLVKAAIKEIYDPEIPVNIYELGLIYKIDVKDGKDGKADVFVEMTLTSPGCPVAQDMPGWVQGAIFPLEGVGHVDVDIVWDPPWDPSMMAETAKLQLNMFS